MEWLAFPLRNEAHQSSRGVQRGRRLHQYGGGIFQPLASRRSRATITHIAGVYLLRFAQEAAWREDNCRNTNGEQVQRLAGSALSPQSISRVVGSVINRRLRDTLRSFQWSR